MRMTRRTLLIGAGAGALGVLLASCTPEPTPSPTPTGTPLPPPTSAIPAPSALVRSAWAADPFARGAASFTPAGVQPTTREALAQAIDGRVLFAGEATDADAPGTMSGAVRSGERAADELRSAAADGERIAVVGAGLAGATAAARLLAAGAEVTVFEARERVGGRIDTRVDEAWPVPLQLGAWLLPGILVEPDADDGSDDTSPDAPLEEWMRDADLAVVDLGVVSSFSPEGEVETAGDDVVATAISAAQALPADVPLAEAMTGTGADPEDPAVAGVLAFLAAITGADPSAASAWFPPPLPAQAYAGVDGDLLPVVERMLEGAQVRLSSPVSRVASDDSGVSLRLGTGESLSFDRVVLTVPLGVLQQNGVEFDPALPFAHRGAIAALGMGDIETVWLRFDEPFWDTEATLWHLVGGEATIRTWFNLRPHTGEAVLVGVVGGAAAAEFAELGDGEVQDAALSALEMLLLAGDD